MAPRRRKPAVVVLPGLVEAVRLESEALVAAAGGSAAAVSGAAAAVELAGIVADGGTAGAARAAAARVLLDALVGLRGLVPEESSGDVLDELAARRAERRGGG